MVRVTKTKVWVPETMVWATETMVSVTRNHVWQNLPTWLAIDMGLSDRRHGLFHKFDK